MRQTDSMKPSGRRSLCAAIIATGVLTAANVLPQSPAAGILRVTVRNNETMEPIAGVRVMLTPTATAPAPAPAQNGAISGRVVDKDGSTPLSGRTIWIDSLATQNGTLQIRQRFTATTDLDGRYRAPNIYIGRVRATLVLNGQPVMTKGEAVGDEIFTASGVESIANFDLSRAPAQPPNIPAGVAGTVNIASAYAAGVAIYANVAAAAAGGVTQTLSTNADGAAVFDKLQPGSYQIRAEREGYMGVGANGLAAAVSATTSLVTVGVQPAEVSMLMMPSASISGRVLDASGAAVPTARVVAGTVGYREGRRTFMNLISADGNVQSDGAGAYTLSTLPAGEYYLRIEIPPGGIGAYYPGVTHIRDALRIPVSTGQQIVGIDFHLPNAPVFKVSGVVVGGPTRTLPNGQPDLTVPSMTFVSADPSDVDSPSVPLIQNSRRGANGEFEIRLPAGVWDIFPVINLRTSAAVTPPAAGLPTYATGRTRIVVTDRDVDNVVVPIVASDIKGRFDMGGAPPNSPMRVSLVPREPTPSPLLSHLRTAQLLDAAGNFSFTAVPPGKYSVRVDAIPSGFYVADMRVGSQSIYNEGILTVGIEQLEPVEVTFRRGGGSVQVRLSDTPVLQQGVPRVLLVPMGARRANILLYKSAAGFRLQTYTFTNVPPGEYKVFAFETQPPGGAEQNAEFMEPYQDRGVPVNVIDGQTAPVDVRWIPSTP